MLGLLFQSNVYAKEGAGKMEAGKKVLVVVYSRTGNTERVANEVAAALGADVEKLVDKTNRSGFFGFIYGGRDAMKQRETELEPIKSDVSKYALVILATPIWGGKMTPAIRTYINKNKDKFNTIACFTTAGGDTGEKTLAAIEELSGKKALAVLGLNKKDIKNEAVYKEKLNKFIEGLKK